MKSFEPGQLIVRDLSPGMMQEPLLILSARPNEDNMTWEVEFIRRNKIIISRMHPNHWKIM